MMSDELKKNNKNFILVQPV